MDDSYTEYNCRLSDDCHRSGLKLVETSSNLNVNADEVDVEQVIFEA